MYLLFLQSGKSYLPFALLYLICFFCPSCKTDPQAIITMHNCNTAATTHDTIVLLVMGQSNAANYGDARYTTHCDNTFNFYAGNVYPLNDPLKGSDGDGGSVWGRLADKLMERNFAKTIIVAPCAVGGTRIEQWIPGGNLHYLLQQTIRNLDSAGIKPTHVLWHQGESNHVAYSGGLNGEQNAANYTSSFHTLVTYLRAQGITAPVYPAITTRCGGSVDALLQNAQRSLADDSLQIFNGPNTDLLGSDYRYDNCHFNEAGLNKHAQMWLEILIQ